jgi:ABC-type branched-subunit amino acid transport system ATPase component
MGMVIEAEALTKRFGGTQALAAVDISAESGQVPAPPGAEL